MKIIGCSTCDNAMLIGENMGRQGICEKYFGGGLAVQGCFQLNNVKKKLIPLKNYITNIDTNKYVKPTLIVSLEKDSQ